MNSLRYEALHWAWYYFFRSRKKVILHNASPLISVNIPTLAQGSQKDHLITLKRLLSEYLPQQTYPHYEAIVYCDGPNEEVNKMVGLLKDKRIKLYSSERTLSLIGHPQTREGIKRAEGDYLVRMNDDNNPFPLYLETLLGGFDEDVGVVYGRVVFKGAARRQHGNVFTNKFHRQIPNDLKAFILPRDHKHSVKHTNIDCMNYMVRMDLAKKLVDAWSDEFHADWLFLEALIKTGASMKFIDQLLGAKH